VSLGFEGLSLRPRRHAIRTRSNDYRPSVVVDNYLQFNGSPAAMVVDAMTDASAEFAADAPLSWSRGAPSLRPGRAGQHPAGPAEPRWGKNPQPH
jgi:hypothetical protein